VRSTIVLCVAAFALITSGCSRGDNAAPQPADRGATATTEVTAGTDAPGGGKLAELDPCDFLSVEQATKVIGSGVKGPKTEEFTGSGPTEGDEYLGCAYTNGSRKPPMYLSLIFHLRPVTQDEFSQRKDGVPTEPVPGIGDSAFVSTKSGAYIDVLDGEAHFFVNFFRAGAQKQVFYESKLEQLKDIAAAAADAI